MTHARADGCSAPTCGGQGLPSPRASCRRRPAQHHQERWAWRCGLVPEPLTPVECPSCRLCSPRVSARAADQGQGVPSWAVQAGPRAAVMAAGHPVTTLSATRVRLCLSPKPTNLRTNLSLLENKQPTRPPRLSQARHHWGVRIRNSTAMETGLCNQ